jgi:hypothetical protein
MSKTLVTVYRIIGIFVSLFSYLLLFLFLVAFFQVGVQGMMLLGLFLTACMVLYSVLSGMFARLVLIMGQPMRYSLKDWIKVNTIVSLIFSCLAVISISSALASPAQINLIIQQYPPEMRPNEAMKSELLSVLKGILVICALTAVHCVWTLRLVRRYREYFK